MPIATCFDRLPLRCSDVAPSIRPCLRTWLLPSGLAVFTLIILSFSTISTQQLSFNLATINSSMVYMGCGVSGCWQSVVAQWLEHWQLKPDVLGSIPGGATFFAAQSHFKGLRTVTTPIVTCFDRLPLRSSDVAPSIGPCLRTWLLPLGLAVLTLIILSFSRGDSYVDR